MPAYTPALLRSFIDELDTVLREAVKNDSIQMVFQAERAALVCVTINLFKDKLHQNKI